MTDQGIPQYRVQNCNETAKQIIEPSDEEIEAFLAERTTPEGRVPMVRTIREALSRWGARSAAGAELAAAPSLTDALGVTGHDLLLRAAAMQEVKDGIGAMDALHDLAIKHGASRITAAGFAHVVNGAIASLEGQVHDEIRRRVAAEKAAQAPAAFENPKTRDQRRKTKEGERHDSEFAYFDARSESDTKSNRKIFCAGFDRGFDAAMSIGQEK